MPFVKPSKFISFYNCLILFNFSEKYVEYLEYTKKGRMNLKMFSKLYLRVSTKILYILNGENC